MMRSTEVPRREPYLLAQSTDRRRHGVFEIRISPETPAEFKAVLQLVQALADGRQGAEAAKRDAGPGPAPVAEAPGRASACPAEVEEIVTIDIPWPPSGEPDPAYSAPQVLEGLQDFARVNGAAALKEVLDRFGARRVSDIKPEHYAEVMTIARGELV
jgi:hypothetical protein